MAVPEHLPNQSADPLDHERVAIADDRTSDRQDDWDGRVAALTRMGFERTKAVDMLSLCGGDVAQAVTLLCS